MVRDRARWGGAYYSSIDNRVVTRAKHHCIMSDSGQLTLVFYRMHTDWTREVLRWPLLLFYSELPFTCAIVPHPTRHDNIHALASLKTLH